MQRVKEEASVEGSGHKSDRMHIEDSEVLWKKFHYSPASKADLASHRGLGKLGNEY